MEKILLAIAVIDCSRVKGQKSSVAVKFGDIYSEVRKKKLEKNFI